LNKIVNRLGILIFPLAATLWLASGCKQERPQHTDAPAQTLLAAEPESDSAVRNASARASPANRNVTIQPLSGRAFAVRDFGSAPNGPVNEVLAQLKTQALAGDGAASYAIFLKLFECNTLNMRAAKGLPIRDNDAAEQCEALSAADGITSTEWLSLAAEQGNIGAQLFYSMDPASALGGEAAMLRDPDATLEYKRKATGYLEGLASQGSADALLQLGNACQAGVLVNEDLVASRAYFEAVRLSDPSLVPVQQIKGLEKEMSSQQLSLALRKEAVIYGSCCR